MAGSDGGRSFWFAVGAAAVALAVAVVALVVALARDTTASGTSVAPWTGAVSAVRTITSSTTATLDGTASSDALGDGRIHSEVRLQGSNYTGTSIITADGGDTIRGTIAGWDVPTSSTTEIVTLTLKIDDGTGRFASASGNLSGSGTILTSGGPSRLTLTFSGVISH
jgi:hypothetical protein